MKKQGFTIVELLVVIMVIAVLVTITVFAFGSWRERTAKTQIHAELSKVVSTVKDYRAFNNGYPATLDAAGYTARTDIPVTYTLRPDTLSYCLRSSSTAAASAGTWYIDSAVSLTPQTSACS